MADLIPGTNWTFADIVNFNDKQLEAERLAWLYKYLLYGGAMGGGKSYWLRWILIKFLMYAGTSLGVRGVRAGLFCEDYPSLKDRHISKIQYEFPAWLGDLRRGDNEFHLQPRWGGGVLAFRNLDDPSKYASSEFAYIGVDELTKNQKLVFDMLRTRMRWPGIEDTKFFAGTNPGGIGHGWVKKIWMDKEFEPTEKEADKFMYLRATAHDNSKNLPSAYFDQLEGLPEEKRKAYLMGDWNLFEGQFFSEWNDDVHICEPFPVPDSWIKLGAYDHGRAKPATFGWYAIDQDGNVWKYRELYVNKEDGSSRWEAEDIAKEVLNITHQAGEHLNYVVADSAIFTATGTGETIAEILMKNGIGKQSGDVVLKSGVRIPAGCIPVLIPCQKGAGSRIAGWTVMHQYLYHDSRTLPKMRYFKNCYDSIRTIPSLVYDENHPEDLDSDGEDHAADIDRYLLQTLRNKKAKAPMTREEKKIQSFKLKNEGFVINDFANLNRFSNF